MHRFSFALAVALGMAAIVLYIVAIEEYWITNVTEFNTLIISAVIGGMVLAAGGLFRRAFEKQRSQFEIGALDQKRKSFQSQILLRNLGFSRLTHYPTVRAWATLSPSGSGLQDFSNTSIFKAK